MLFLSSLIEIWLKLLVMHTSLVELNDIQNLKKSKGCWPQELTLISLNYMLNLIL